MSEGNSVELTAAEYNYARNGDRPVHLAAVSAIRVEYDGDVPWASGGVLRSIGSSTPQSSKPGRPAITARSTTPRGSRPIRITLSPTTESHALAR